MHVSSRPRRVAAAVVVTVLGLLALAPARWQFTSKYAGEDTVLYNTGPVTSLDDPDLNFWQTYRLEELHWAPDGSPTGVNVLAQALSVAPSYVGRASMPDYRKLCDRVIRSKGDVTMFAGQADDPFFFDLRMLSGGDRSEVGDDTFAPYNVNTLALQLPISRLIRDGDPVVGIWSTTSRRNSSGQYVQLSRLGMPLVNDLMIPVRDKDRFNASSPAGDSVFLKYVVDPAAPRLIEKLSRIKAPATPRKDLVQAFLTGLPGLNQPRSVTPSEQLRLNTSIPPSPSPKRLGVLDGDRAGFPNGRRLTDDVVDITLQVAAGEWVGSPNDLGDAVDANDKPFEKSFPYVALPKAGSEARGGSPAQGTPRVGSSGSAAPRVGSSASAAPRADSSALAVPRADSSALAVPRVDSSGLAVAPSASAPSASAPSVVAGGADSSPVSEAGDPSPAANASAMEMTDLLPLVSAVGGAGLLAFGAAWLWRRRPS